MCGLECVPLNAYCLLTGESAEIVKRRVESKAWRLGTHVIKIPGCKDWWVDLDEVNRWVRLHSVPLTDKELGFNLEALEHMTAKRVLRKKKK